MLERLRKIGKVATVAAALSLPVGMAAIKSCTDKIKHKAMSTADLRKKRNEISKRPPIYPGYLGAAQVLKRSNELAKIDDEIEKRDAK